MIDERLHGERERTLPRVYARPVELRRGQSLSEPDLIARLNDLGYAQRHAGREPGEFAVMAQRGGDHARAADRSAARSSRVTFPAVPRTSAARGAAPVGIRRLEVVGAGKTDAVRARCAAAHGPDDDRRAREAAARAAGADSRCTCSRPCWPSRTRASTRIRASTRFALIAAAVTNVFGNGRAPVGNSTITQQLARMFFLADEFNAELQSGDAFVPAQDARGALMSLVLERRASKDEILELYLNDVYLGQRGSFAIHGVAEARASSSARTSPT